MAATRKLKAKPPIANGTRVLVSQDLQFCVEFRGSLGTVVNSRWQPRDGWLFDLTLDAPVTVSSGNVHTKLGGVPTDDLKVVS